MRLGLLFLATVLAAQDWPGFRGPAATGVADNQDLPAVWDSGITRNVRWKTPIPGLAHSSPIEWRGLVFVTTAVSSRPGVSFKRGLYGEGTASDDTSIQKLKLLAIDRGTGTILWERTAYQGAPKEKRHIKSTYANSTPATDGHVVVAFFGSHGIYAYDFNGKPLWSRDLGRLDAGAYNDPSYEWGTASSPIIDGDRVIVQCDQQKGSFLIALDRKTGETVWKTERDELPSWGTPAAVENLIVTNGSNAIRAYDSATGKQIWQVRGSSKITAPTPVSSGGVIIVASGRGPEAPIFAIRPDGTVAWSKQQRGPYMPTPLIYQERLYTLANQGILDCYNLKTGEEIYRQRLPLVGSGFSASPVAADGKIYLSNEDGEMLVIAAGEKFTHIATNSIGELLMATPALSDGVMYVRSSASLFAIARKR